MLFLDLGIPNLKMRLKTKMDTVSCENGFVFLSYKTTYKLLIYGGISL